MSIEEKSYAAQLSEIREALAVVEKNRFLIASNTNEKVELEEASIVLRNRERELISLIGKEIAESIKSTSSQLKALSKKIRTQTLKMSTTTQSIKKIKNALLLINKLCQNL